MGIEVFSYKQKKFLRSQEWQKQRSKPFSFVDFSDLKESMPYERLFPSVGFDIFIIYILKKLFQLQTISLD